MRKTAQLKTADLTSLQNPETCFTKLVDSCKKFLI